MLPEAPLVKDAEQAAPQSMPAGADVTVPLPLPTLATPRVNESGGAFVAVQVTLRLPPPHTEGKGVVMLAEPDADVPEENVPVTVSDSPISPLKVLAKAEAVIGIPGLNGEMMVMFEQAPTLANPSVRDLTVLLSTTNEKGLSCEVVPLQEPSNDWALASTAELARASKISPTRWNALQPICWRLARWPSPGAPAPQTWVRASCGSRSLIVGGTRFAHPVGSVKGPSPLHGP